MHIYYTLISYIISQLESNFIPQKHNHQFCNIFFWSSFLSILHRSIGSFIAHQQNSQDFYTEYCLACFIKKTIRIKSSWSTKDVQVSTHTLSQHLFRNLPSKIACFRQICNVNPVISESYCNMIIVSIMLLLVRHETNTQSRLYPNSFFTPLSSWIEI